MWVATAIVGGSALTALSTGVGASTAAKAQTDATQGAQNIAIQQYLQNRRDQDPYRSIGQDASNRLGAKLDEFTTPINMDQATLEQTPGYKFALSQGLKSTQNSAAARGLGSSGAALKGAANFATGLADQTYQTQFNIANTNQTNAYNRLKALVDTGQNAAAQTGASGTSAANTAAGAAVGAGNAQAAASNAIASGVSGIGNNIAGYGLYKGLYGGGNNSGGVAGGSGTPGVPA